MKKKIMLTVGSMAAAAVLGLGIAQSSMVSAGPNLSHEDVQSKVESQYPGQIKELELEESGENPVYEVEIEIEGKEYELLIDGNSGEVLKLDEKLTTKKEVKNDNLEKLAKAEKEAFQIKEKQEEKKGNKAESKKEKTAKNEDKDDDADDKTEQIVKKESKQVEAPKPEEKPVVKEKNQEQTQVVKETKKEEKSKKEQKETEKKPSKKAVISKEKAVNIALGQFSGKVEEVELDKDDGRLIYEVEIESSRGEAEIEIDAYSGKVLVVDIDLDDDSDDDD